MRLSDRTYRDNSGLIPIRWLICILVLALIIYAGVNLGMPYYRYYSLRDDMKNLSEIRPSAASDGEILDMAMAKVTTLNIPIGRDDIVIEHSDGKRVLKTHWTETVSIFVGRLKREYNFSIDTSRIK